MSYRIGIIGAGVLARQALVPALENAGEVQLAAILDVSADALATIAPQCPEATLTTDVDRFFAERLDAVHVATPNDRHERYARLSLEYGLATLIDKPLAHTVASGRRIQVAANSASVPALVGYMAKHNVYNREARRLVAIGAIGTPLTMTASRLGWRKYDWRSQPAVSGLGCLADLGIYPILTAGDLFDDDPVRCQASVWPVHHPQLTDVYAQATLWFDRRRYMHFETAATFDRQPASAEVSAYTLVGENGILQVGGSWAMNGSGSLDLCDSSGWHSVKLAEVDPYVEQYRLLAACLAGLPVPPEVCIDRGLADLEILYAITSNAASATGIGAIRLHSPDH